MSSPTGKADVKSSEQGEIIPTDQQEFNRKENNHQIKSKKMQNSNFLQNTMFFTSLIFTQRRPDKVKFIITPNDYKSPKNQAIQQKYYFSPTEISSKKQKDDNKEQEEQEEEEKQDIANLKLQQQIDKDQSNSTTNQQQQVIDMQNEEQKENESSQSSDQGQNQIQLQQQQVDEDQNPISAKQLILNKSEVLIKSFDTIIIIFGLFSFKKIICLGICIPLLINIPRLQQNLNEQNTAEMKTIEQLIILSVLMFLGSDILELLYYGIKFIKAIYYTLSLMYYKTQQKIDRLLQFHDYPLCVTLYEGTYLSQGIYISVREYFRIIEKLDCSERFPFQKILRALFTYGDILGFFLSLYLISKSEQYIHPLILLFLGFWSIWIGYIIFSVFLFFINKLISTISSCMIKIYNNKYTHQKYIKFLQKGTRNFCELQIEQQHSQEQSEKEAPVCSICISEFSRNDRVFRIDCPGKHIFHSFCLYEWLKMHLTCPYCRAIINIEEHNKNKKLSLNQIHNDIQNQ